MLVAVVSIGLSLPHQTASAASLASCPVRTDFVRGNTCFAEPEVICLEGQHLNAKGTSCVRSGEGNTDPDFICPEGFPHELNSQGLCSVKTAKN